MKSTGTAYLLWFASIFGILGFHQFYLGNASRGITYIFTVGWLGVGAVIDMITMSGQVRKANNAAAMQQMARNQQPST